MSKHIISSAPVDEWTGNFDCVVYDCVDDVVISGVFMSFEDAFDWGVARLDACQGEWFAVGTLNSEGALGYTWVVDYADLRDDGLVGEV